MSKATSVIIPCYNGEKFLLEALESVRAQTVAVREIIVVDDGSKVPVRAPERWEGPPLHIHRTPNRRAAAARNFALMRATGEFVAFLDADDFWHPRQIELQEQALRADSGAVGSYTRCVDAPGFFGFGPYPPLDVSDDEFLLVLWYNLFFPPSAFMARREVVLGVGPFRTDLRNGEDIELYLRLLTHGRFVQVPQQLCSYRLHDSQFTHDVYRKLIGSKDARAAMIAQHADRLISAGLRPDKLWDSYRNDILLVYYRRQFAAARRLLYDYWKDHPRDLRVLVNALVSLLPAGLVSFFRGQLPEQQQNPRLSSSSIDDPRWANALRSIAPVLAR